jgi:hypothetical protein
VEGEEIKDLEEGGQEKEIEVVYMIKVHYMHIVKCQDETLSLPCTI